MQAQGPQLHPLSLNRIQNIFFLNGITSLLGWNAALGALDYFSYVWSGYNVYLYFPVPVFIAYAVTCISFNWISTKFSYTNIVKTGIIGLNVMLVLLLLISIIFKNNISLGFTLTLVAGFFLGFFNNFVQLSFFAMINYFGMQTVSRFTIGTAASGLMVIIIRAIITAIFGDNQDNVAPIVIYFCLSIAFNFFDLFLNLRLFKSDQYTQKIQQPSSAPAPSTPNLQFQQSILSQKQQQQRTTDNSSTDDQQQQSYAKLLWQSFKVTTPYPLFIFFNFVFTFMLFPGLTLAKKTTLGTVWTNIVMLMMYNIGDFIGKLVGDFRKSFNQYSICFMFFSRLFFFYTIPLMDKAFTQDDHLLNNNVFPFFNQVLFAFTNGLVINGSFILAYEQAPNQYKKYAGVLGGIVLQLGIMIGTFLAIPFESFVSPDLPDL